MNINSELPPEILLIMFHKLSLPNLPNCRLVCRAWNSLISNYKFQCNLFITLNPPNHLHCVQLDHNQITNIDASFKLCPKWHNIKIANSCNGLLCISTRNMRTSTDRVAILNPVTNEYIVLPGEVRDHEYHYTLGFSSKTKQYKVVRHHLKMLHSKTLVEIFAFGTRHGEWSRVAFDTFRLGKENKGVYLDGVVYWIGVYESSLIKRYGLWRLKVENEKFEEIYCPPLGRNIPISCGVYNDTLYVTFINEDSMFHVWTIDEKGLWIRTFVIDSHIYRFKPIDLHFQLIKLFEDGKILCRLRGFYLALYDPATKKLRSLYRDYPLPKFLWFHQINSFDFHSLPNILAGHTS